MFSLLRRFWRLLPNQIRSKIDSLNVSDRKGKLDQSNFYEEQINLTNITSDKKGRLEQFHFYEEQIKSKHLEIYFFKFSVSSVKLRIKKIYLVKSKYVCSFIFFYIQLWMFHHHTGRHRSVEMEGVWAGEDSYKGGVTVSCSGVCLYSNPPPYHHTANDSQVTSVCGGRGVCRFFVTSFWG